ncbi:MAG: hypothetical protein DMG01_10780 [Acidobacteria bacterium]|nr:MAG: hypothetical protein DMG01_10780 [Acidobacteriota bacterium]
MGFFASSANSATSSDGRDAGIGFRNKVLMTVNIVVLAPMPSASDNTAVTVTTGFLTRVRTA